MQRIPVGRMAPAHLGTTFAALAEATEYLVGYREFRAGNFQRLDALLDEIRATAGLRPRTTATTRQAARRRRP